MMTGLIDITSGDARVFGYSVKTEMDQIQEIIGVCSQQNVLWDDLTVKEHLEFFARLKGLSAAEGARASKTLIEEVGLAEKMNVKSAALSGGQKRKLCVAIAFMGDPKVVFLDEPTSGMDVNSRRATWELIKKKKKGRVIILTTHFMDEADLLGDRIGVMAKGDLICCGTSLFLKSKYGVGYSLVITKADDSAEKTTGILNVVKTHLKDFKLVNSLGGEIFFQLPLKASPSFPPLFRELEARKHELAIRNFGISVTTLEEVFLKVGESASNPKDHEENSRMVRELSTKRLDEVKEAGDHAGSSNEPIINQIMKKSGDKVKENAIQIWFRHFRALLVKRYHNLKRDKLNLVCLIMMPFILMFLGIIAIKAQNYASTSVLQMDLAKYPTPLTIPFVLSESNKTLLDKLQPQFANQEISIMDTRFPAFSTQLFFLGLTIPTLSTYLEPYRSDLADEIQAKATLWPSPIYGLYQDLENTGVAPFQYLIYINQTALHGKLQILS
jgi:ATP-binding cassette subfamily A (ABC1) protein 3